MLLTILSDLFPDDFRRDWWDVLVALPNAHLEGEVLILAGDMVPARNPADLEPFLLALGQLRYQLIIVVAGNHDHIFQRFPRQSRQMLSAATIHYLEDEGLEWGGLRFWGSPWTLWRETASLESMAFAAGPDAIAEKWVLIPDNTDILITHSPPHGILDGSDYGFSFGCPLLSQRVAEIQPLVHIFGHVHEDRGIMQLHDNPTTFINGCTPFPCLQEFQQIRPIRFTI